MIDIKLRAWDEGKFIMHNNFQYIKSGEEGNDWIVFTSDKQTLRDKPHPFENPYFQLRLKQLKVMRCTDIKDANGKEIYEGDVIKGISKHKGQSHVFYEYGVWQPFSYLGTNIGEEFEVIGNIYENVGMLETNDSTTAKENK